MTTTALYASMQALAYNATLALAELDERVYPHQMTRNEQILSYKAAQALHLENAERCLRIAAWLNRSPSAARRRLAIEAIQDARKRTVAAETCAVFGNAIAPEQFWFNRDGDYTKRASTTIWHRIEVIRSASAKAHEDRRRNSILTTAPPRATTNASVRNGSDGTGGTHEGLNSGHIRSGSRGNQRQRPQADWAA